MFVFTFLWLLVLTYVAQNYIAMQGVSNAMAKMQKAPDFSQHNEYADILPVVCLIVGFLIGYMIGRATREAG